MVEQEVEISEQVEAEADPVAAMDQEIQGGFEEKPKGPEPDPRVLIPSITAAMATLGAQTPGAGATNVMINLQPTETPQGWVASAFVDVYGELQTTINEEDPDASAELEADHLTAFRIEGESCPRVGDALQALHVAVGKHLQAEILARSSSVAALEEALSKHESR